MTRSYIHFDAQSTKKASAFVFRRNSAELTPAGPVLSATSALPAESFFDREGATWANRYRNPTYDQRRQLVGEIIRKEVLKLDRAPGTIRLLDFGCTLRIRYREQARRPGDAPGHLLQRRKHASHRWPAWRVAA